MYPLAKSFIVFCACVSFMYLSFVQPLLPQIYAGIHKDIFIVSVVLVLFYVWSQSCKHLQSVSCNWCLLQPSNGSHSHSGPYHSQMRPVGECIRLSQDLDEWVFEGGCKCDDMKGRREALESTWSLGFVRVEALDSKEFVWFCCEAVCLPHRGHPRFKNKNSLASTAKTSNNLFSWTRVLILKLSIWISFSLHPVHYEYCLLLVGGFSTVFWSMEIVWQTLNNSNHLCSQRKHTMAWRLTYLKLFLM